MGNILYIPPTAIRIRAIQRLAGDRSVPADFREIAQLGD